MRIGLLLFMLSISFLSLSGQAQQAAAEERISALEKRLEELELSQGELQTQFLEGNGQVRSFFNGRVNLGGFFENAIASLEGPDMDSELSANSHLIGLNISSELSGQFRFVSQVLTALIYTLENPHNNPDLAINRRSFGTPFFGSLVAQAFIEYQLRPSFRIQSGLGYAPFGHAIQLREPVLFKRRGGPQLANSGSNNSVGVAFPLWMGAHVFGNLPLGQGRWGYHFYTFSPSTEASSLGTGTRAWWKPTEDLTVGISGQMGKESDSEFYANGADVNFVRGRYGVTAEYAHNEITGTGATPETYYVEPYMTFERGTILLFAAADYIKNDSFSSLIAGTPTADPYERWSNGAGINWLPTPFARFRLSYMVHQYLGDTATLKGQERNFSTLDFSTGVTF